MDTTKGLEAGALVQVKAWGGAVLVRRVVFVREDTVAVCCEEEYEAAKEQGREPSAIGFTKDKVVPLPRD
jgi:hypothetical protein